MILEPAASRLGLAERMWEEFQKRGERVGEGGEREGRRSFRSGVMGWGREGRGREEGRRREFQKRGREGGRE